MKSLGYVLIALCLLLCNAVQAEEERQKYGDLWNSLTDIERSAFLLGFREGMSEGWMEIETYLLDTIPTDWESDFTSKYWAFCRKSIARNFPEIRVVRDVMTSLYADPSNIYLRFRTVFLTSVAKIRGTPPGVIERLLATARKQSYVVYMMTKNGKMSKDELRELNEMKKKKTWFRSTVYREIYGGKTPE